MRSNAGEGAGDDDGMPRWVVTGCGDCTIHLTDSHTGERVAEFGAEGAVGALVVLRDSNRLVFACGDTNVYLCSLPSFEVLSQTSAEDLTALVEDDNRVLILQMDGGVFEWNLGGDGWPGEPLIEVDHDGGAYCLCAIPGSTMVATGGEDRRVCVSDLAADGLGTVYELVGHDDCVSCLAASPDGAYVVSGSDAGDVRVWSMGTGECLHALLGHEAVTTLAVTADGRVLSTSNDKMLRVWLVRTGELYASAEAAKPIESIDVSPAEDAVVAIVSGAGLVWALPRSNEAHRFVLSVWAQQRERTRQEAEPVRGSALHAVVTGLPRPALAEVFGQLRVWA